MLNVDIGVFAHNESNNIINIISTLKKQNIFNNQEFSIRVFLLANGCTDNTVSLARQELEQDQSSDVFHIYDLSASGKSRTWNHFVHNLCRQNVDHIIFCDSDIEIPNSNTLKGLLQMLEHDRMLSGVTSKPIKDITYRPQDLSMLDKIISGAAGTLNDWKRSICGQLYVLKSEVAKKIFLPIGLPVEDGFIRAMVLTENLSQHENIYKLDGDEKFFHIYKSERKVSELIKHQTRIVIGSSINAAVFSYLRDNPLSIQDELRKSIRDEYWLPKVIKSKLPTFRYGWVHHSFLFKRLSRSFLNLQQLLKPRNAIVLIIGFTFDLIVYIRAQVKMAGGVGAGHW